MTIARAKRETGDRENWIRLFREGDRTTLAELYRRHFRSMSRAAAVLPVKADRENIIQEVFFRLISDERLRASYGDGDMGAWLHAIVRNQSIGYLRRRRRETSLDPALALAAAAWEGEVEARLLVERFRREVLPQKWAPVFEARFIRQLSQGEAAATLGIARTTLAYQEDRLRELLRRFLLGRPPGRRSLRSR